MLGSGCWSVAWFGLERNDGTSRALRCWGVTYVVLVGVFLGEAVSRGGAA